MHVPYPSTPRTIHVTSPDFRDGEPLPRRFTCHGDGLSPAFDWSGVPSSTVAVAVVVSDPDAPRSTFLHWLVTGLPGRDGRFEEGSAPTGTREWPNSGRAPGWYPPCPPSGRHRYVFAVHALDAAPRGSTSEQVLEAIGTHTIAWGSLTGLVRGH